jgi:hypothetical protein
MENLVLDNVIDRIEEVQPAAVQTIVELSTNELALIGGGTANVSFL